MIIKQNHTGTLKMIVGLIMAMLVGCSPANDLDKSATDTDSQQIVTTKQISETGHTLSALAIDDVVFAINFGGDAFNGVDGIFYQADTLDLSAQSGTTQGIRGSQESFLFESYRAGALDLSFDLANGEYAINFKFAEPEDLPIGSRVFNVVAEENIVINSLDVRLARDGNHKADVVRTVTNVVVSDNSLDIKLSAIAGEPIISAMVVRKAPQASDKWRLVWQDEFNYEGPPNPAKWQFDIWPARKVNDEDQAYTDRAKNVRVENGHLVIEAHLEDYDDAQYTSGRIHAMGKGDFLYGKVDVRAKLPAGQGTWSAAWMLPSDPFKYATNCVAGEDWQGSTTCDAWPNSGEIDIIEHVGYDMHRVHGTVHTKAYYWVNGEQRKASVEGKNVDEEFHLYSMEWSPQHIMIAFNNIPYFYYNNEGADWRSWPFDHPYHVILNLAVGGAWGRAGGPIDDSIFPVKMLVDYVRIYQASDTVHSG